MKYLLLMIAVMFSGASQSKDCNGRCKDPGSGLQTLGGKRTSTLLGLSKNIHCYDVKENNRSKQFNNACPCIITKFTNTELTGHERTFRKQSLSRFGKLLHSRFIENAQNLEQTASALALAGYRGSGNNSMAKLGAICNPTNLKRIQCDTPEATSRIEGRAKRVFETDLKTFVKKLHGEKKIILANNASQKNYAQCMRPSEAQNIGLKMNIDKRATQRLKLFATFIASYSKLSSKNKPHPADAFREKHPLAYKRLVNIHPLLKSAFASKYNFKTFQRSFLKHYKQHPKMSTLLKTIFSKTNSNLANAYDGMKQRCQSYYSNIKKILCDKISDTSVDDYKYGTEFLKIHQNKSKHTKTEALYCKSTLCKKRVRPAKLLCPKKKVGTPLNSLFDSTIRFSSELLRRPPDTVKSYLKKKDKFFQSRICPYLMCTSPIASTRDLGKIRRGKKQCHTKVPASVHTTKELFKLYPCLKTNINCKGKMLASYISYELQREKAGIIKVAKTNYIDPKTGKTVTRYIRTVKRSAFSKNMWDLNPKLLVKPAELREGKSTPMTSRKRSRKKKRDKTNVPKVAPVVAPTPQVVPPAPNIPQGNSYIPPAGPSSETKKARAEAKRANRLSAKLMDRRDRRLAKAEKELNRKYRSGVNDDDDDLDDDEYDKGGRRKGRSRKRRRKAGNVGGNGGTPNGPRVQGGGVTATPKAIPATGRSNSSGGKGRVAGTTVATGGNRSHSGGEALTTSGGGSTGRSGSNSGGPVPKGKQGKLKQRNVEEFKLLTLEKLERAKLFKDKKPVYVYEKTKSGKIIKVLVTPVFNKAGKLVKLIIDAKTPEEKRLAQKIRDGKAGKRVFKVRDLTRKLLKGLARGK